MTEWKRGQTMIMRLADYRRTEIVVCPPRFLNNLQIIAMACICLLGPLSAQAWTDDGKTIVFSHGEIDHCKQFALEAGEIMLARQSNEPPRYQYDQYGAPSEATLGMRDILKKLVLTYPARDTAAEKRSDLEDFAKKAKRICIKAYMEAVPASPSQRTAAP